MIETADVRKPRDDSRLEVDEPAVPLTDPAGVANTVDGDMQGSAQVGAVFGGMTIINGEAQAQGLVASRVSSQEIEDVRCGFVAPDGFAQADTILRAQYIVILHGRGTGRSYAARKLLVDYGAAEIALMDPDRALRTVRDSELRKETGYIWAAGRSGDRPLSDWDFTVCLGALRRTNCRLVILLDGPEQVPSEAITHAVALSAPSPIGVARAAIRRRWSGDDGRPFAVLESDLAVALRERDPPSKAARAAALAIQVANGECDVTQALDDLREDVEDAVRKWFDGWSIAEYAMSLAVALLENQPYDEVVHHALALEVALRAAELREGLKPWPRRMFTVPKERLLADIRAQVVRRPHPTHAGLEEETVRFDRQDWASALLHHVWREYPTAHRVLLDWMCSHEILLRFRNATRRAVCSIIAEVPAHDPLRLVRGLASTKSDEHRLLAGLVLTYLADEHDLLPLVRQTLEAWVDDGPAYGQWVAATVYSSPFGRRDIDTSLAKMRKIAQSKWMIPKGAVVGGLLSMLCDPEHRAKVIATVVTWSECGAQHPDVRATALKVGLWAAGFRELDGFDATEFSASFHQQVRKLVDRALIDSTTGSVALDRLFELAQKAAWDDKAGASLVRLATLIIPDLRWWRRERDVMELCRRHYGMRSKIRWAFRVARKAQRSRERSNPDLANDLLSGPGANGRSSDAGALTALRQRYRRSRRRWTRRDTWPL